MRRNAHRYTDSYSYTYHIHIYALIKHMCVFIKQPAVAEDVTQLTKYLLGVYKAMTLIPRWLSWCMTILGHRR